MFTNEIVGRGASGNPQNRFIPLNYEPWPDYDPSEDPAPKTQFFLDDSRTALASNDSPDVPFTYSLNPYRGCEHGCIYCYARPTHEYLSFSAGLDFESKIMVKRNAAALLERTLRSKKWVPETIAISGVTDCYQPAERRFFITRQCLEVLARYRNPVGIVTKNALVVRDTDVLADLASDHAAAVHISVTTLDSELARRMEPRASAPAARLRAMRELSGAGIPVGVMFAPVIPGLNDHEVSDILGEAAAAGAKSAGYVVVRLPYAVKDLFQAWLQQNYPERKARVLGRIRDARGGSLTDPRFGSRMSGEGAWADSFRQLFNLAKHKWGFTGHDRALSTAAFRRPGEQLQLF